VQEKKKLNENIDTEEKDNDVYFDKKKGKLIIKNAEEKTFIQKKRVKNEDTTNNKDNDSDNEDNKEVSYPTKKRKIQEKDGNIRPVAVTRPYVTSRDKEEKPSIQSHIIKFSGKEYSGKGGRGDLLLKNKPDPFAYIQLNPKANSKKRRNKSVKVFEQVMRPNKSGTSISGLKIKTHK